MVQTSILELEAQIERILQDWHVAGGSVSIIKDGEVLSSRGYGLREIGKTDLADEHTVFGIGSNTKSFTAAGVAMLVDEGKLNWDDKIIKYLPDFAMYDSWVTQEVTLRDVLSHRTGLAHKNIILYNGTFSNEDIILRRLRHFKPQISFRSDFNYNNYNFMIAGLVIEKVTGMQWTDFMHERFFKPLGMTRTFSDLKSTLGNDNLSGAHANVEESFLPHYARLYAPEVAVPYDDVGNQPAGGINSTAHDLIPWMKMLLNNGVHEGKPFLSSKVIEEMTAPSCAFVHPAQSMLSVLHASKPPIHFYTYGMGWFVLDYRGVKMFMHGGQITGFNSAIVFFPEKNLAFSILLSSHQTIAHVALVFQISDTFLGGDVRDWNKEYLGMAEYMSKEAQAGVEKLMQSRKINTTPSLSLPEYAGTYANDFIGNYQITMENGKLFMRYGNGVRYAGTLEHWQEDTFYAKWEDHTFDYDFITFMIKDAKAVGMQLKEENEVFHRTA
jgi:CubicO group peptidase (beta-lactamase class C family)